MKMHVIKPGEGALGDGDGDDVKIDQREIDDDEEDGARDDRRWSIVRTDPFS